MATTAKDLDNKIDMRLSILRNKKSCGEIMETDIIQSAEAMRSAMKLITVMTGRIEAL